jgi:hypothetical protein
MTFDFSFIKEGQTIQWTKDTKGEIKSHKSKKDRQYNGQKIPKEKSKVINQRRTDIVCPLYCLSFFDL